MQYIDGMTTGSTLPSTPLSTEVMWLVGTASIALGTQEVLFAVALRAPECDPLAATTVTDRAQLLPALLDAANHLPGSVSPTRILWPSSATAAEQAIAPRVLFIPTPPPLQRPAMSALLSLSSHVAEVVQASTRQTFTAELGRIAAQAWLRHSEHPIGGYTTSDPIALAKPFHIQQI